VEDFQQNYLLITYILHSGMDGWIDRLEILKMILKNDIGKKRIKIKC
jgi:hypothetical protein